MIDDHLWSGDESEPFRDAEEDEMPFGKEDDEIPF